MQNGGADHPRIVESTTKSGLVTRRIFEQNEVLCSPAHKYQIQINTKMDMQTSGGPMEGSIMQIPL